MSANQQERLLAGAPFVDGGELDEIASFMRALPAYAREEPGDVLAAALVPRLAQEARASTPATVERSAPTRAGVAIRHPLSRRALVARVAVAVALVPASMAALAVAGVHLPDPAKRAFENVGVDLPNQASESAEQAAPTAPSDAEDTDLEPTRNGKGKGNAFGKAGDVPQGKALGHAKSPAKGGTPPGQAKDKTSSGNGSSKGNGGGSGKAKKSPPGRTKPKPPPPPQSKRK